MATYEEISIHAAAGDPVGVTHLAWWDRHRALQDARGAIKELRQRLHDGDERVTAAMLTKADAELVRCEALNAAAEQKYKTAKRQAPKDQVIAETVTAALESIGLPLEPTEKMPYLTVTATDHPEWDYVNGHATGSVRIDYIASDWHRAITEEEIGNALTSSPLTAAVSVNGGGSPFTARLIAHRAVPEIFPSAAQAHRWHSAQQGIKGTAQNALIDHYGVGHDDWGSTGHPRVGLAGCTLTFKGETREGDVIRRKAEAVVAAGYTKGVDRGEANGVVREALLDTVGHLWPALGVVERADHATGQTYLFTLVSRAKAGEPEKKTFTHEWLGA